MKINVSKIARYLPLAVGIAIIAIGSLFVPWGEVWPFITGLSLSTLFIIFLLSLVYYFGRILRFWLMLGFLGHNVSFAKVTIAYLIAQPVTILPVGELYRSVTFKKYVDIPRRDGIPTVFAQSFTESIGLLLIATIGALFIHRYVAIVVGVLLFFLGIFSYIRWQNSRKSHKAVNKLPKVNLSLARIQVFFKKNRLLLSGKNFIILIVSSFIATFAGIAVLYVIARDFGAEISLFQAAIAFSLPVILQTVTFLPGGLGANEQGSVGILALFGLGLPVAVAITLIVRLVTLGLGFVYGFIAMAIARLIKLHEYY